MKAGSRIVSTVTIANSSTVAIVDSYTNSVRIAVFLLLLVVIVLV
jgi:hypothetical protein